MKRFHADFVSLLDSFTLETLEKDSNPIFGLSADLDLELSESCQVHFRGGE